jgi:hypothetical protein
MLCGQIAPENNAVLRVAARKPSASRLNQLPDLRVEVGRFWLGRQDVDRCIDIGREQEKDREPGARAPVHTPVKHRDEDQEEQFSPKGCQNDKGEIQPRAELLEPEDDLNAPVMDGFHGLLRSPLTPHYRRLSGAPAQTHAFSA